MEHDNEGYLPLFRRFQRHEFWTEKRVFSRAEAWIDILFSAQYGEEPRQVMIKNVALTQNYGEILRSHGGWAYRWGWSESKVRRFFKQLKKRRQIDAQSAGVTTRLSVVNFATYDLRRRASDEECDEESDDKRIKGKKKGKEHYPPTPHQEIVKIFRECLPMLPGLPVDLPEHLKKTIKARWRESLSKTNFQGLDWFRWYFTGVSKCDFLVGKNDRKWSASFSWLMGPKNMTKVLSGEYNNRKSKTDRTIEGFINGGQQGNQD